MPHVPFNAAQCLKLTQKVMLLPPLRVPAHVQHLDTAPRTGIRHTQHREVVVGRVVRIVHVVEVLRVPL